MNKPDVTAVSAMIGAFEMSFETGRLAKQAHGSVFVRYGTTAILAAVVHEKGRPDLDFFPLTVEYRESKFAAGKIPGGFFKREGRLRRKETLTCRLIDRPLRPLFPDGYREEVQVSVFVYSGDADHDPDVVGINAASAALVLSEIPFDGPIGAVRVGRIDGALILNPDEPQRLLSTLDLVVAGTADSIMMVEASAKEVPEDIMVAALQFAHEQIKRLVQLQLDLAAKAGRPKLAVTVVDESAVKAEVAKSAGRAISAALANTGKVERNTAVEKARADAVTALAAAVTEPDARKAREKAVGRAFDAIKEAEVRKVIGTGRRLDGRRHDEIRPIWGETGLLPGTHGSAVFTRGETQAIVIVTLGSIEDTQPVKGLHAEREEKFYLHYDFLPFCVGEVGFYRGPGRREIGHGMLAQKALEPMVPKDDAFPYTMRVNSHILESNGSSSMASICGATLAMMDAGVNIIQPVAGIAMGLIMESGRHFVLSDIMGDEDHYGDMDFKVGGTRNGITALQMDIKIKGLSMAVMTQALGQARAGRIHILDEMLKIIDKPRDHFYAHVPKIVQLKIDPSQIGGLIGPGGKTIKKLEKDFEVEINISDDGVVHVSGKGAKLDAARATIDVITRGPEMGKVYRGTVKSIKEFGAFVEIVPGVEGLVHVSELAVDYVKRVEDVVKLNDMIDVKVINIDQSGKIKLSRKALMQEKPKAPKDQEPGA
ncbi:MAG: polyribonucleotide nucleotidyltransferase [Planctomycetota bacterium]